MPVLMHHLGLSDYAKASVRSPFRNDKKASWGIFEGANGWRFKDHGIDQNGDEISLLALHLNIDERENFHLLVQVYAAINLYCDPTPVMATTGSPQRTVSERPDPSGLAKGTEDQIKRLSQLRMISVEALSGASLAGTLLFGQWHDHEVYGVSDQTNRIREIRRLDGENFPAVNDIPERKSHAIKNSDKSWPVGVIEASVKPNIILAEGLPDFLAAYDLINQEGKSAEWSQAGMLSANASISEEALPYFKGKRVLIFPHADDSGVGTAAAIKWRAQLQDVAQQIVIFDSSAAKKLTGGKVSDLNEFITYKQTEAAIQTPQLNQILS